MNAVPLDPASISDRAQLAAGLRALRENSGVTFRELVHRSGGLQGTISGWLSGHHLPIKSSADMFDRVLVELGVDDKEERRRWWDAVGRVRSSRGRRQSGRGRAPYKGLESFDTTDAEWFFGRADVVEVLNARVKTVADGGGGVIVVLGASGSGKSSVLRAGLATGRPDSTVRSGVSEVVAFTEEPTGESLLIFDQLEELWTHASADERARFLDVVQSRIDEGAVAVVGLRADFYSNAIDEPVLTRGLVDNPVVLGRLSEDQLRDVIVEPARKAAMTVEDALLRTLLAEMEPSGSVFAHDQGALPMLSHALLATWQSASGSVLTVDDYVSTGGLPGAVQQSAEKVFSSLTDVQQHAARRTFVRLVNIDGDVLTRRRVARVELFRNEASDDDVEAVIEDFTAARLLTVEEETVSVTHEVLLAAWDRLRAWIEDDRQWLLVHRRLTDAAVLWDEGGREEGSILPATRLATIREALGEGDREDDLNAVEREYVEASDARHRHAAALDRRRRRTLKALAASLTVISVLAVSSAVVAFSARSEADERRIDAEAALSGQLAGVAERLRDLDPGLSVHLALAAFETNPTTAARSALLDASAIHAPVRLPGVPGEARSRLSPTGTTVANAGADGIVRLWSIGDGPVRQVGEIDGGGEGTAVALEFAPSSDTIALGGAAGTSLWSVVDPTSPMRVTTVGDASTTSKSVAFSPDATVLASVSGSGEVSVWDVSLSPAATRIVDLPSDAAVNTVAFSPDGRFLLAAGAARSLRLWDTASYGSPVIDVPPDGSTYDYLAATFSPDGRSLVAGTTGREVARWSVSDRGELVAGEPLTGFTSYVNDVAFSGDGTELSGVSSDNSIRLWDAETGVLRETLPGSSVVTSVDYSADGSTLTTTGQDGVTRLWPRPGPLLTGQTDTVYINPIDGAGTRIVAGVGSRGDGLRLWDVTDPDRPVPATVNLTANTDDPLSGAAAISWDGAVAAGGTASGAFQLWDVSDPLLPVSLGGPHAAVDSITASLAFDRSGRTLAVSPQNTTDISIWDVSDPAAPVEVSAFDLNNNPQVMTFSPDGRTLAIPTLDGVVELWDLSDPSLPRRGTILEGFEDDASTVAYSPDGRILAAGSADKSVRLWDVIDPAAPQHIARIGGPLDAIYSLAFDASGTRLAAGVGGRSLWVWDVTDPWVPTPYANLTAYGNRVNDAVFTRDGDALIGGGPERDLRVWRTDPAEVKQRICAGGGLSITQEEWEQYLPGIDYRELC